MLKDGPTVAPRNDSPIRHESLRTASTLAMVSVSDPLAALDRWPVGQAVFAAIIATSNSQLALRQATALVAAAARGAALGNMSTADDKKELDTDGALADMQTTLHILGVKAMPQALAALRGSGQSDLAKRVARQSKARNWMAHPDTCLHKDLQHFMAADMKRAKLDEPRGADAFFMGELTADAALQTSPRKTNLDNQLCSGD